MSVDKMWDWPAYCRIEMGGVYRDLKFPSKLQMVGATRVIGHNGSYEYLKEALKHKKIEYVVDVGANAGYMSMAYSIAWGAEILALEPVEKTYEYLLYNAETFPNITPLKMGALNKKGRVRIAIPTNSQRPTPYEFTDGNVGLFSVFGTDAKYSEIINVDTLDNLATKRVDYLKLDIEGAEMLALQGAKRILSEDRPIVQIELRPENIKMAGMTKDEYKDFFLHYNYSPVGQFYGDGILMPNEISMEVWTLPCFV